MRNGVADGRNGEGPRSPIGGMIIINQPKKMFVKPKRNQREVREE